MKKNILSICLVFFSLLLYSCSSEEEIYSCDPNVDQAVKDNLEEIHKMNRADWLDISDYQMQRAVYNAFTAEQKHAFWISKLTNVLEFDWNAGEKEHIQKLMDYATVTLFERKLSKEDEIFFYKWNDYAKEELDWDMQVIGAMTHTGLSMVDMKGTLIGIPVAKSATKTTKSWGEACGCSVSSDWCGGHIGGGTEIIKYCEKGANGCYETSRCGTLLMYTCDGDCVIQSIHIQ